MPTTDRWRPTVPASFGRSITRPGAPMFRRLDRVSTCVSARSTRLTHASMGPVRTMTGWAIMHPTTTRSGFSRGSSFERSERSLNAEPDEVAVGQRLPRGATEEVGQHDVTGPHHAIDRRHAEFDIAAAPVFGIGA